MTYRTAKVLTRTPWLDGFIFVPIDITLTEARRLIDTYRPEKQAEFSGYTEIDRYYITPDLVVIIEIHKY